MTDQVNQHSKIIVGLLLAATIAVDLMVANWLREMGPESRIVYVYEALATAQLAVVTIWAVLGAGPALAKWIAVAARGSKVQSFRLSKCWESTPASCRCWHSRSGC
jgi:hypothetical protein